MVDEGASVTQVKRMRLRYPGTCARCGASLAAGTNADYDRASKTVACAECPPLRALPDEAVEPDVPPLETVGLHPEGLTATPPRLGVVDGQAGRPQGWSFSGATTPGRSG